MYLDIDNDDLRLIRAAVTRQSNLHADFGLCDICQRYDDLLDRLPEPFDGSLQEAIAEAATQDADPDPASPTTPRRGRGGVVHRHEVSPEEWADMKDAEWDAQNGGI